MLKQQSQATDFDGALRGLMCADGPLAIIDIGTFKTVCMILLPVHGALRGWRVAGVGHQISRGIKARVVVGAEEAERSLRAAVIQAEQMAGFAVERAIVGYNSGRLQRFDPRLPRAALQDMMREKELTPLLRQAGADEAGEGALRVFAADEVSLKQLLHVVEQADLTVEGVFPSLIGASLAVTTAEERGGCVAVIDMGAGGTSAALIAAHRVEAMLAVPVGGQHMTFDIAKELQCPLNEAERIKLNHGILECAQSSTCAVDGDSAQVDVAISGSERGGTAFSYMAADKRLGDLIEERVGSLMRQLATRMEAAFPVDRLEGVVLAGGAAATIGAVERARQIFGTPVRSGRPYDPRGIFVDGLMVPPFTVAIGAGSGLMDGSLGQWWAPSRHGSSPIGITSGSTLEDFDIGQRREFERQSS